MKGFDAAQRAYDNMVPPGYDDDGSEREEWEGDLDLLDIFTVSEMKEIIWEHFHDEPWFKKRLDEAWAEYLKDAEADAFMMRGYEHG